MNVSQRSLLTMAKPAALICLALASVACADRQAEMALELFGEKKALDCRMEQLHQQADSLWDEVAASLSRALPADMPADERRNMIQVRNTGLIMMFQSFPTLDTAIQNQVVAAGKQDEKIAGEMRAVLDQLDAAEQKLNAALEKLEDAAPEKYGQVRSQLQKMEKAACR